MGNHTTLPVLGWWSLGKDKHTNHAHGWGRRNRFKSSSLLPGIDARCAIPKVLGMEATPRVLVLLADGYEEIETVTPIDLLRRANLTVWVSASTLPP